jgi:hypothetical protein
MMDHEQARPESWDTTPMPDRKAPIALQRTFTPQEYERLKRGLVPQAMEDKWLGYGRQVVHLLAERLVILPP